MTVTKAAILFVQSMQRHQINGDGIAFGNCIECIRNYDQLYVAVDKLTKQIVEANQGRDEKIVELPFAIS